MAQDTGVPAPTNQKMSLVGTDYGPVGYGPGKDEGISIDDVQDADDRGDIAENARNNQGSVGKRS